MLAITLDNLAHRYNCLPSEAFARATTFDLYILDISARWVRHQENKSNGTNESAPRPSEAEMLKMLQRVKEEK